MNLLDDIYYGQKSDNFGNSEQDESLFEASDLSKIIYNDGQDPYDNDDFVKKRWKLLADACEENNQTDISIEIMAALTVRMTMKKALNLIAEDEKEQFDYYT